MRRVKAANPSLTVGALSLAPEFPATFRKNFMTPSVLGRALSRGKSVHPYRQARLDAGGGVLLQDAFLH